MTVMGLLLAAGAGRRMGQPKALVRDADGTSWLCRSTGVLLDGGCQGVAVVLGAEADAAAELLAHAPDIQFVIASRWAEGMGASLSAGLAAIQEAHASAVLVHLVDLPDVTSEVVRRVIGEGPGPDSLRRATYDGRQGHPVLIGRGHWDGVISAATGDQGARVYLSAHQAVAVECGDLATGHDVDTR